MSALELCLAVLTVFLSVALALSIRANRRWVALNERLMGLEPGQVVVVESPWWETGERRCKLWKMP